MKQRLFIIILTIVTLAFIVACTKKNSTEAIKPEFGTSGNPNPNYQTVTGTTTYTDPPTQNTQLEVGGPGWTNPTCISTNSRSLKGFSGNTDVTLTFNGVIQSGTFAVAPTVAPNVCTMRVINAPNQPAGIVWISKTGSVSITSSTSGISASFNGIVCTQANFNFPVVSVSGGLSCGSQ